MPNSQVTGGQGLCQAPKIYEAPAECGPGLASAASAPRFIFDFHLIIFFLPLSTRCPGRRTKGGGWGDGAARQRRAAWVWGSPQHSGGPLNAPGSCSAWAPRKERVNRVGLWGGVRSPARHPGRGAGVEAATPEWAFSFAQSAPHPERHSTGLPPGRNPLTPLGGRRTRKIHSR